MSLHHLIALPCLAFVLVACGKDDQLERRFHAVAIGDARAQLLSTMQVPPCKTRRDEVLVASWERATWVDRAGRRFEATLVLDRVVAKSIH